MSGLVTSEFRVHNAKQFIEAFSETEDNMYFFVGRNISWDNENDPPVAIDAKYELRDVWTQMIALKKILPSDVTLGLRRYDWTSGVTYDAFDDQDGYQMFKQWYVVTSQNQVFACLNNGKALSGGQYVGTPSTYEPFFDGATPSVTIFNTPDGYTWKYMYTIAPGDFLKFSTPTWMPCTPTETPSNGSSGIYSIILTDFGSGYSVGDCYVTIQGDGTGAQATPVIVGGQITKINITNPGSGYTRANVVISGTNTGPASARAVALGFNKFGARPAVDLGAYYAISSVSLQYGEGGVIPTYNEYRQFGIIRNPLLAGGALATSSIYNMVYRVRVNSSDLFDADEQLTIGAGQGTAYVIEYDTSDPLNKYLTLGSATAIIQPATILSSGVKTATVVSVEDQPDLTPGSGDILYLENTQPIYRTAAQTETFCLVSEF